MTQPLLSISLKCYEPKTYGNNDLERKKELRDLILNKIENISDVQQKCRGKKLSFEVCFNLYSDSSVEGRKTKDLDNMLKIFCDVFPEFIDRNKTVKGLGLLEDDRDDLIFEINCEKRLVGFESEEGIDFSIYEYPKL
ncbi:hypothetical protein C6990_05355 [Nitrosopumilus sp. b3]|uniref:hypothetical protein n=1 Tax=Nitrosopumilus sp. b3 TaxID=2109909 RepID=UPI0015F4B514|nr:hypothetical protein [Nitrosopumilus sp. b3]KAF6247108.1 hypothetical protein C6990_05355 [Nitrosopumilus sp. b3]